MTGVQVALWLSLAGPPPDAYFVPGCAWSYEATLNYYADAMLVPRSLARKIVQVESKYNPRARSREWKELRGIWKPGKVLARGLMQISVQYQADLVKDAGMRMPRNEADLSNPNAFVWHDPAKSIRVGVALLSRLGVRYHWDRRKIAIAYNAGPGWVGRSRLPLETREYLKEVLE